MKKFKKTFKKVLTLYRYCGIINIESEVREWQREKEKVIKLTQPTLSPQ